MKQLDAKIIENKKIAKGFYRMRLESAYLAKNSMPGQFVEVKCSEAGEAFLRRPFGVHSISKGGIDLLYEVIGKGTGSLSAMNKGGSLDVIGPIGKSFELPEGKRSPLIVAGGIGVAPLFCLAEKMAKKRIKSYVLIGARTASHILCEKEFRALGCSVNVATEDGSKGRKGFVTDLLRNTQYTIHNTIYACGPAGMLKAVAGLAEKHKIPCQVSMEEHMACGVGVCLGCPVRVYATKKKATTQYPIPNTQYEYKMVCKDGPVFNAKEISW